MKIRYRPAALRQLEEIFAYIEAHNPSAARRVNERIKRSIERLASFPYSARQTEISGIRVLPIVRYPYVVFYAVDTEAEEVLILRVRHTARKPDDRFD